MQGNFTLNRTCKTCLIEKPLQSFKGGCYKEKVYYKNECRTCINSRHRRAKGIKQKTVHLPFEVDSQLYKICSKCEKSLKISEFHKCSKVSFGFASTCKTCKSKDYFDSGKYPRRQNDYFPDPQMCQECQVFKSLKKFGKNIRKDGTFGYLKKCIACTAKKNAKFYYEKRKIRLLNSPELLKIKKRKDVERQLKRKMTLRNVPTFEFTKEDIIKRDGLSCYLCLKLLTEKEVTLEHLIPISRGGSHKAENVKIACRSCNSRKRTKTITEFKKCRGDYTKYQIKLMQKS